MEHMDYLQRQSHKLDRQLAGLYREVECLSGIAIRSSVGGPKQMDQLRHQESQLRQQIQVMAHQLPIRNNCVHAGKAAARLRDFLATTGGERGGWDESHHALFLHLRSRIDKFHLIDSMAQAIPDKSREQIQSHEEWYRKVLDLKRQQRQELEQWKQHRKQNREESWRQWAQEHEFSALEDAHKAKDLQRWVATWKKQRQSVQQQLEQWRLDKAEKQKKAEAEAAQNPAGMKKPGDGKRIDQEYQKLLAYLWRVESKAAKDASQSAAQFVANLELRERGSAANRRIRKRHERNLQWIEQRRQVLIQVQQSKLRHLPASSAKTVAVRDPKRILRSTSASAARQLPPSESGESVRHSYILDIPIR